METEAAGEENARGNNDDAAAGAPGATATDPASARAGETAAADPSTGNPLA